jgi:hypothetical protein
MPEFPLRMTVVEPDPHPASCIQRCIEYAKAPKKRAKANKIQFFQLDRIDHRLTANARQGAGVAAKMPRQQTPVHGLPPKQGLN